MNQNQLPSIDIIIVNYNGMDYLPSCLKALFSSQYPPFSVIVVDNHSVDESVNWIKANYPEVILIENRRNIGFGNANLKGIHHGSAPFFALLNNDTRVDSNWLLPLVNMMKKDPLCAAACSRLLFMDHPEVINAAGGGMNFVGYGYDHDIFSIASSASTEIKEVFFPTAAACLIRRSAFDDIDGFDRAFFMYHEDVDLGWRFHLRGYSVKYIPQSVVFHAFGGTSLKSGSMHFRNRLGLRHALRTLLKNYEIERLKQVVPLFCKLSINNFLAGIPTGFFRALFWNFLRIPDTIIKRVRIQRRRRVADKELFPLIWQDVYLPVQFPDYQINNISSFIQKYNKNNVIDLIDTRSCNLGYGWHSCELYFGDGQTLYRWTREQAKFFFWHSGKESVLKLKVLGLSELLGGKRAFSIELRWVDQDGDGKDEAVENMMCSSKSVRGSFTVNSDQWECFEIPFSGSEGAVEVHISVESTWSPHEKFNNRDYRRFGIGVASAEICNL